MRKAVQWFVVKLPPADQPNYRETALSDTRAILRHWVIVVVISVLTLAASIIAAVGSDFSAFEKVVLAAVGAGVGTLIFLGPVVYLGTLIAAPHRQRNQARIQLHELRSDSPALAEEFSNWVLAKRASLPTHGMRLVPSLFDSSGARSAYEQRQDELDRLQARARAEYHDRFRASVVELLGADHAGDPRTISDLEALAEALRGRESTARRVGEP